MPALVGGESHRNRRRSEESDAPKLPPVDTLHGVHMPGGNLHRTATEHDHGFMSLDHVRRLQKLEEEVAKRPVLTADQFAAAAHDHPPTLVEHEHDELRDGLESLEGDVEEVEERVAKLESRPILDPAKFAEAGHSHPPPKLPAHDHPHTHEPVGEGPGFMLPSHVETIQALESLARAALAEAAELRKELEHVRKIAEQKLSGRQEHGYLIGGRLHEAVTDRLAGFMVPDQKRQLEILWDLVEKAGGVDAVLKKLGG